MLDTTIKLTLSVIIPTLNGFTLIYLLFRKHKLPIIFHVSLAYGAGLGILSLWMMLLGGFGFPFNIQTISLPLNISTLLMLALLIKQRQILPAKNSLLLKQSPDELKSNSALLNIFLFLFICLNLIYSYWRSLNIPIYSWDAVATVAYKAKIFYFEQKLPPLEYLPHQSYPLLTPLSMAWIAISLGQWSDQLIKVIFPLGLISFLSLQYYFLRFHTNKTWALGGCALLISSNLFLYHSTIAYRDFFLMYFNCTTIILLLLWGRTRITSFLILSSLFSGFTTFTKLEGTAFLTIHLILFVALNFSVLLINNRNKIKNTFFFLIPSATICISYHIYKWVNNASQEGAVGVGEKLLFDYSNEKLLFIPHMISTYEKYLFYSGSWGLVWGLLVLSLFRFYKTKHLIETKLLCLSLLLFFSLYFLVGLLTTNYIWIFGDKAVTGLSRLILHFFPLAPMLIILLNFPRDNQTRSY